MRLRELLVGAFFALGAAVPAACDSGADEAAESVPATSSAARIEIESSLEGTVVLPRRIRWTASVSLPPERVQEVRFFIDEELLWTDPDPPYAYGEEGAYLGSWMEPGPHRFRVRVLATDGGRAGTTVVAVVRQTPKPELYGVWGKLAPSALADPPQPGKAPRLTAWMNFPGFGRSLWIGRSIEHVFAFQTAGAGKTLHIGRQIFRGTAGEGAVIFGWHLKGSLCDPEAPPATYRWSISRGRVIARSQGEDIHATNMTLRPLAEPCEERRRLLTGVWEVLD